MNFKLKKEWLGQCVLLFTLALLLWLGPGRIWGHRIDHGYPYAFNAADAFQHQSRTEGILRIGDYRYEPMEHLQGEYPEFPGYYPPIPSQLGALWASFPGLESFHTMPGLVFISTILSAALMYVLVRRFNAVIAILSLPLYGYLFLSQITFTYYTWGHWPALFGQVFLVLLAWAVSRMETRGWEIVLALALIGSFMAYTAWTVFGGIFLGAFLVLYMVREKGIVPLLIKLALAGGIALIVTSRVLVFFLNIWMRVNPYTQRVFTEWSGGGGVPALGFPGIPLALLAAMSLLAAYTLASSVRQKDKPLPSSIPLLFSITMFVLGFSNYYGFTKWAFFIRLFWPLYLSPFLGLTVYQGGRILLQKLKWSAPLAGIVALAALLIITAAVEKPAGGEGVMNRQLWEAFTWLRDSTPPDSDVWVMYGDGFVGDMLWNLQKPHYFVTNEAYVQALQNMSVHRYYLSGLGTNSYPYWVIPQTLEKRNPLCWGWAFNSSNTSRVVRERDLCSTDYILFTKQSYQPILAQYGLYIANLLLEKPWMTTAFQNDYALVLHNAKTGDACIEDQRIEQAG